MWVHHSRIITLSWVEKRDQLPQHLSCLTCLGKWWTFSAHLLRTQQQIRPCLTQVQLEKTFCYKQSNWAQFCQETKFAKSIFNSSVVELLFRKSSTNCIVKTEIQVFIDLINLDRGNFGWLNFLVLYGLCLVLANIAS